MIEGRGGTIDFFPAITQDISFRETKLNNGDIS